MTENLFATPENIEPETDGETDKIGSGKNDPGTSELCPHCHIGTLKIDGCLNLSCPLCGFTQTGGGFT